MSWGRRCVGGEISALLHPGGTEQRCTIAVAVAEHIWKVVHSVYLVCLCCIEDCRVGALKVPVLIFIKYVCVWLSLKFFKQAILSNYWLVFFIIWCRFFVNFQIMCCSFIEWCIFKVSLALLCQPYFLLLCFPFELKYFLHSCTSFIPWVVSLLLYLLISILFYRLQM